MNQTEKICVICGDRAFSRIELPFQSGFLYSCEDEECQRVIKVQIRGALKNQN